MNGQISIFELIPLKSINTKNECLGEPCMYCDVEWCSLLCFIRRGYLWDGVHEFVRDGNGKALRKSIECRECTKDFS